MGLTATAHVTEKNDRNRENDDLLLALARTRDKDAFVALFRYFAPRIKAFLMRGNMPEQEAEELTQDTLLSMWQKADQFDPYKASATTWVYTIARNKKIDRMRKNGVVTLDLDDLVLAGAEPAVESSADGDLAQGRARDRLAQAIGALPPEQALVVRKAFYDDMSHGEIAAATDIPLGTVKSRLRLGLERLRQNMFVEGE
jgi:RNA polymerase sigma-70 factor (ECF subfamily)